MKEIVNDIDKLIIFLKNMIIETLKLEDITIEDIGDEMPLFREGLELDSLDALELVVAVEKNFNVIIEDENVGRKAFASVRALALFIRDAFSEGE